MLAGIAVVIGWLIKFLLSIFLRRSVQPHHEFSLVHSILFRLGKAFNYFLPLLLLNMALPLMRVNPVLVPVMSKLAEIALTLTFAALVIGIIKV